MIISHVCMSTKCVDAAVDLKKWVAVVLPFFLQDSVKLHKQQVGFHQIGSSVNE